MIRAELPDNEELWIELSDGSMISINTEGHVRISTWSPEGNCIETLVFKRPFHRPRYVKPAPF